MMARKCDHCGYEFASSFVDTSRSPSWAYGKFASGCIAISMFICWLYCVFGIIAMGYSIIQGEFLGALFSLLSVIAAFGLSAGLARVEDLK